MKNKNNSKNVKEQMIEFGHKLKLCGESPKDDDEAYFLAHLWEQSVEVKHGK